MSQLAPIARVVLADLETNQERGRGELFFDSVVSTVDIVTCSGKIVRDG